MTRLDTTRQRWTPAWLLCSLPLALAACDTAGGPATTMEVDSAGIPITTALAPVWGPGDEWTISEEPLVQIGAVDGAAEYLLGSVSRAVRLSDGDIVLGDWSNNVLRRYDREGVFVWEASRQGEGPGEHLRLLWVGALASDSIVTWDGVLRRVQIFGPDGVVGRTFRVEAPWSDFAPSAVQGIWGRNLVMSFHDYRGEMPEGRGAVAGGSLRDRISGRWRGGPPDRCRGPRTGDYLLPGRPGGLHRLPVRQGTAFHGQGRYPRRGRHGGVLDPVNLAARRIHITDYPARRAPRAGHR